MYYFTSFDNSPQQIIRALESNKILIDSIGIDCADQAQSTSKHGSSGGFRSRSLGPITYVDNSWNWNTYNNQARSNERVAKGSDKNSDGFLLLMSAISMLSVVLLGRPVYRAYQSLHMSHENNHSLMARRAGIYLFSAVMGILLFTNPLVYVTSNLAVVAHIGLATCLSLGFYISMTNLVNWLYPRCYDYDLAQDQLSDMIKNFNQYRGHSGISPSREEKLRDIQSVIDEQKDQLKSHQLLTMQTNTLNACLVNQHPTTCHEFSPSASAPVVPMAEATVVDHYPIGNQMSAR